MPCFTDPSKMTFPPTLLTLLTFLCLLTLYPSQVHAQSLGCSGGTLSVVAHADDDLLFQAPYIFSPLNAACFPTVFVTAGDAGHGMGYAVDRERGNEAAKAAYLGVSNSWSESTATYAGQAVTIRTLRARPGIQNIYFRLPDGNVDGSGFSWDGYPSLLNMYSGYVTSLTSIDGRATFTYNSLRQALGEIMSSFNPSNVITQDYMSHLGSGDHSDHLIVARITAGIVGTYAPSASLSGFMGYPASAFPPTGAQDDPDYKAKEEMFFEYTPYDFLECQSYGACADAGRAETSWLLREYVVNTQLAQTYVRTLPPNISFDDDIALLGSATASSSAPGQPPSAAINGVIGGYRADGTGRDADEWSSDRQGLGAYWQVTWDYPVSVNSIILYDRPNLDDQITSGSVTLDGGNTLSFGFLPNDGTGYAIPIGNVTTTSVFVRVGSVGYRTVNAGLSEVVVLGSRLEGSPTNNTDAGPTPGTGTGDGTSFAWSNDIALFASASASSSAPDQGASKAIDGQLGGYDGLGGDYTQEWSSNGEGVGASLLLSWSRPVEIYRVLAYDRPNADDQITAANIAFGDGTRVQVGQLAQDGSATSISLPSNITTTTLRFTVSGVSPSTKNAGLRELVVLGAYASTSGSTNGTNSTTVPPVNSWSNDLALQAMVTASSYDSASPPSGAVDAIIGGYLPEGGEDHTEWSSNGEKSGAWIQLQWMNPVAVSSVVLYDRINLDDQITSGTLTFDNGAAVAVGQLPNDGSGVSVSLGNRTISELRFTVNTVSSSTVNVGLAEIAVFGSALATPSNGTAGDEGSGTPIGGGGGGNTTEPTPGGNGNGTTPIGGGDLPQIPGSNIALLASASASSSSPGQGPEKARDGQVDGYTDAGGDWTKEWASASQGAGAWIQYEWEAPMTVSTIVLSDRPNPNDQILSGTLTFSDGSSQAVGSLPNEGSTLSISASKDGVTSLRFTVDSVSWSTINVGLAEMAVLGYPSSNATARLANVPDIPANGTTTSVNSTLATPTGSSLNTTASLQNGTNETSTVLYTMPVVTSANATVSLPTQWLNATTATISGNATSLPTSINISATTSSFLPVNTSLSLSTNLTLVSTQTATTSPNVSETALPSNVTSTTSLFSSSPDPTAFSTLNSSLVSIVSFSTNATSAPSSTRMTTNSTMSATSSTNQADLIGSSSGDRSTVTSTSRTSTSTNSTPNETSTTATSTTRTPQQTATISSTGTSISSDSSALESTTRRSSSASSTNPGSSSSSSSRSSSTSSSASSSSSSSRPSSTTPSSSSSSRSSSSTSSTTSSASLPTGTTNIARLGTCKASSSGAGTPPSAAIDGNVGSGSNEWTAGSSGGIGSWIQIDFSTRYALTNVRLYDRQGSSSGIQSGLLTFSDGSNVFVGSISRSGTTISLGGSARMTRSIRFTVLTVASGNATVGLAEIEAYNGSPP